MFLWRTEALSRLGQKLLHLLFDYYLFIVLKIVLLTFKAFELWSFAKLTALKEQ